MKLARKVNPVEAVRSEVLLTAFIAGLCNPTFQRDFCKAKPADADAGLQAAVETYSSLGTDGLKMQTSGVNNISTETSLDTFTELVLIRRTEIEDAAASHHVPTEIFPITIKKIARPVKLVTDIGVPQQDRDALTLFPNLKT